MLLKGKAHRFGDDISADLHIFDKHTIFARDSGGSGIAAMAEKMLTALDPGFPARRRPGDFIVAGRNFGALSSYDQSAEIVKASGIAAVLAASFDDHFFRHAVNRGLLLVRCDTGAIRTGDDLEVDLAQGHVRVSGGATIPCEPPHPLVGAWQAEGGVIEFLRRHGDFAPAPPPGA